MHLMHVMAGRRRAFDDGSMDKQTHPWRQAFKPSCAPIILTLGLAAFLLALLARPSGGQEEVWTVLLRDQLLTEKQCELNYTTNLRKFELAGQQALDVRAHCKDKRAFDASWRPEEQRYYFKQCEPVVC